MASWHMPQSVPAPEQRSPTAERVCAPDRTAASISRSLTHLQMQRIIVALPSLRLRLILNINKIARQPASFKLP
jgi:hypothetical protein